MRNRNWKTLFTPFFVALMLTPLAAPAQEPGAARSYRPIGESSPELREYRQMQPVMDEMAAQIARMRDQMSKGDVTAEREREMAAEMKVMSGVMRSMAGRMGHPAMRAPERVKELRRMRRYAGRNGAGAPDPFGPRGWERGKEVKRLRPIRSGGGSNTRGTHESQSRPFSMQRHLR